MSSNNEEIYHDMRPGDHNPGGEGSFININVSHGPSRHQVYVPAHSTFGYVKKVVGQQTGLEPQRQKILFRGKEKEEGEYLNEAGVKDNSKFLVLETKEKKLEDTDQSKDISNLELDEEMSKTFRAIAETSAEIDKLAERVAALEVAVNSGTKVSEEEFIVSSELLMRQLLKLDTVEAEGEVKMHRKAEVHRLQNFLEILDNLKVRNSKNIGNSGNTATVTTEWEAFVSGLGSSSPSASVPSSTRITQDWESFD